MKEKPYLQDQRIVDLLRDAYGIEITHVEFLPIGDISSAKYRVMTKEQVSYFLKLRRDNFKEISVAVPWFLHAQGIHPVLAPLQTRDGRLWTNLDAYTCILYPYIEGKNGFQKPLSKRQWSELGKALRRVHAINLPPELANRIPCDTFTSDWRNSVRQFLAQSENISSMDPIAAQMADGLQQHRDEIRFVLERADTLAGALKSMPFQKILCHADIHAGNLLLEPTGVLHLVDWDDPILAPKERDLMFIGGGIGGIWNTPAEVAMFYQGYGGSDINLTALTFYRYERIVSDIGEFCQQLFDVTKSQADRERSLQKYYSIFLPNQVLDIARQTDSALKSQR